MGIRLVKEAAMGARADLTWRERYVLLVLATSAMDDTRECAPGIEDNPDFIARTRLASRTQRYAVIASLVGKGALLRLERGRNGVRAVFAIAPFVTLPDLERPRDPDVPAESRHADGDPARNLQHVDNPQGAASAPVENPVKGPSNRDASASAKGPGSETEGSRKPGLKGPVNRDASRAGTSYRGSKGFKTGGRTPPAPLEVQPVLLLGLPKLPPEEGDSAQAKNPAPSEDSRQALAAEIRKTRPEWSTRSILRALERPSVAERPWPIVAEAMRLLAADRETQHAGRLEHDGPWWRDAARKTRALRDAGVHQYENNPETGSCRICRAPEVDKCHRQRRTA
jgi:hypothetical protein